jgi:hypothetical protein
MRTVEAESLKFHLSHGDFEVVQRHRRCGMAKKARYAKMQSRSNEDLRGKLGLWGKRGKELAKIAQHRPHAGQDVRGGYRHKAVAKFFQHRVDGGVPPFSGPTCQVQIRIDARRTLSHSSCLASANAGSSKRSAIKGCPSSSLAFASAFGNQCNDTRWTIKSMHWRL